jgi:type 1 glutamine amidotransferase
MSRAVLLSFWLALGCNAEPPPPPPPAEAPVTTVEGTPGAPNLLVFSRALHFRHDSIETAVAALAELARQRGYSLTAVEDPTYFSDATLSAYGAVIFLMTTGDVLDDEQQAAFERFIRAGKGYVGVHSASDTEYAWPWYGELVGSFFRLHSSVVSASVTVEDPTQAATQGLPSPWTHEDEWYAFAENPRPKVSVLLTVDETSYYPGAAVMGSDHPVAWQRTFDGGRSFYTSLGHTRESYSDPTFMAHLTGGIEWALGLR